MRKTSEHTEDSNYRLGHCFHNLFLRGYSSLGTVELAGTNVLLLATAGILIPAFLACVRSALADLFFARSAAAAKHERQRYWQERLMTPDENPLVQLAAAYAELEELVHVTLLLRPTKGDHGLREAYERVQKLKGAAVEAQRAAS